MKLAKITLLFSLVALHEKTDLQHYQSRSKYEVDTTVTFD